MVKKKKKKIVLTGLMVGPITEEQMGDDWQDFKRRRNQRKKLLHPKQSRIRRRDAIGCAR